MKTISLEEVEWSPLSGADPIGKVFYWDGGVYRAIKHEATSFVEGLFKEGIVDKLIARGFLIETETAPVSLEGFRMVLRHRSVPFPSYPFEWCAEMFRDAASLTCDLSLQLASFDLGLSDAHPWNIMFEGCEPRFIDIGSIVPQVKEEGWPAADGFAVDFLYPLYAMAAGKGREARHLMRCEVDGGAVFKQGIDNLCRWHHRLARTLRETRLLLCRSRNELIRKLRDEILAMRFKLPPTEWSSSAEAYNQSFIPFQPTESWSEKQKNVYDLLLRLRPKTVIDIGSNVGWYSELAARQGCQAVAMDSDEASITTLYKRAKSQGLPVHTTIVDFIKGTASHIALTSASERLRGEMVLALGLVHHLVFKNYLDFDVIAKELSKYADRWLVVEFVPPGDPYPREKWVNKRGCIPEWYRLENFLSALRRFFPKVEVLESASKPRKLVFCRKQ